MLSVREMTHNDLDLLLNYWYGASEAYLKSLGADIHKMPVRADFRQMVATQIDLPYKEKKSYPLLWENEGIPVGHSNVNQIQFGESAYMHLHLWKPFNRQKGAGSQLVKQSLPFFFEKLALQHLFSEPYALNPAPNRTLEKIGFTFLKKHLTIPGSLNFEQEVNCWRLTKDQYLNIH